MNLRNNKGFVMTDVAITIIILLIFIPTIMGTFYSIGTKRRATEAKSEAINIATNSIEAAKGIDIEELDSEAILQSLLAIIEEENEKEMSINEKVVNNITVYTGVIKTKTSSYLISTNVVDYADNHEARENIVKTVTVNVKYRLGGTDQEISLSTVIK